MTQQVFLRQSHSATMRPMEDLSLYDLQLDPIKNCQDWLAKAKKLEDAPDAFILATSNAEDGHPRARTLLCKGLNELGLLFFTNYLSDKGKDLEALPYASAVFCWPKSMKQIRLNGVVKKAPREVGERYFHSRPFESQVASFISQQDRPLTCREELLAQFHDKCEEFKNREVPYPEHWGGYYLQPNSIEFFLYGEYRLNDRFLYSQVKDGWKIVRLSP